MLCEDQQSQVLIVRALRHRGVQSWEITKAPLPSDSVGGAGEQYVRERYVDQVRAVRDENRRGPTALIVHIDADPRQTVEKRRAQLAESLRAANEKPLQPSERIAELVPKRNIETWIHALDETLSAGLERPLDEERAYPKLAYPSDCAVAAESFAEHARNGTTPDVADSIPSLAVGIAEFRRAL